MRHLSSHKKYRKTHPIWLANKAPQSDGATPNFPHQESFLGAESTIFKQTKYRTVGYTSRIVSNIN